MRSSWTTIDQFDGALLCSDELDLQLILSSEYIPFYVSDTDDDVRGSIAGGGHNAQP